jgi:hypothetical protein
LNQKKKKKKKKKKMGMEHLRLQLLPCFEQTNFLSSSIQSHYDDGDGGDDDDDEAWAKFSSSCDHRELILRQQQERCA